MEKIKVLIRGIFEDNPILFSTLGLCPALAITTKLENALGMGIAFIFVIVMSNIVVSLIRKLIPNELRIPIYIVIIASFVTIIEMLLNAFLPKLSDNLGIFLSLLVVNCIILGRAEAFASKNNIFDSFLDGLGTGIGYTLVLCIISIIREISSYGKITIWRNLVLNINSLFNTNKIGIFSQFFVTSSGAYLILGIMFAIINLIKRGKKNEHI